MKDFQALLEREFQFLLYEVQTEVVFEGCGECLDSMGWLESYKRDRYCYLQQPFEIPPRRDLCFEGHQRLEVLRNCLKVELVLGFGQLKFKSSSLTGFMKFEEFYSQNIWMLEPFGISKFNLLCFA